MRAFAVRSFGEVPAIHDLPIPAGDGALLIRVKYAGVNPIDYRLVDKLTAGATFPFVLGIDFAGVVERVPAAEHDLRVGDRVFGMARTRGAYAEYTSVAPNLKTEPVARIPDGVTDEQAAALPIAGITALRSIDLLNLTAGQKLVVVGAVGGVGGYAVQIARARGAHVIAVVRGGIEEARSLGADEVYNTKDIGMVEAVRLSHPNGVDAVFDLVNPPGAIGPDAEILKPGASIVSARYAADAAWFAERQITAHNVASISNPLSSPQGLGQLARMLADGTITARIRSIVELDGTGQVLERLRNGGLRGKAVIRL